jgi:hypothetical protein
MTDETDDEEDRRIRAEVRQQIRDWEVSGFLWSEIDADGKCDLTLDLGPKMPTEGT